MGGVIKYLNEFIIEGAITKLIITRGTGEKIVVLIDTEDLTRVRKHNWSAGWRKDKDRYYIQFIDYYYDENGVYKGKTILLHKYIMEAYGKYKQVDHEDHDSLNNLKENLRVVVAGNNSANRSGANKNSSTGVRNVHYIKSKDKYMVQIMKDGISYKWDFELNEFEEACKFAEKKRKELFGKYAGTSSGIK